MIKIKLTCILADARFPSPERELSFAEAIEEIKKFKEEHHSYKIKGGREILILEKWDDLNPDFGKSITFEADGAFIHILTVIADQLSRMAEQSEIFQKFQDTNQN